MIDHHAALIYTMVLASAADRQMTDAELHIIGDIVNHLPVFAGYEHQRLTRICAIAPGCSAMMTVSSRP